MIVIFGQGICKKSMYIGIHFSTCVANLHIRFVIIQNLTLFQAMIEILYQE